MIIWNGRGFLIAVIIFASLMGTQVVAGKVTNQPDYYQTHTWLIGVGLAVAGLFILLVRGWLFPMHGQTMIHPKTGESFRLGRDHGLFFISVKWWPWLLLLGGAGFAAYQYYGVTPGA